MSYTRRFDRQQPHETDIEPANNRFARLLALLPVLWVGLGQGVLWSVLSAPYSAIPEGVRWIPTLLKNLGVGNALLLVVPTLFYLSPQRNRRLSLAMGGVATVVAYLGWFDGWMRGDLLSFQGVTSGNNAFILFTVCFCCAPYLQRWISGGRYEWYDIFRFFTLNLFSLLLASLFWGMGFFVLKYTGRFFAFFGIGFLQTPSVVSISLSLLFAVALTGAQKAHKLHEFLYRGFWGLFCWIFPGVAFLGAVFLLSHPFGGLALLGGNHSVLFFTLSMQCLTLFLCFATWRGGTADLPFPSSVDGFVRFHIATLPLYSFIGAYALGARVSQYGWSVNRIFAAVILFVLFIWAVSYCAVLIFQKKRWVQLNGEINRVLVLVSSLILLFSLTPLFDVYRFAAASQTTRFLSGRTHEEQFDYNYMRFQLGARGSDALRSILNDSRGNAQRGVRLRIQETLAKKSMWGTPSLEVRKRLIAAADIFPAGKKLSLRDREALLPLFKDGERIPPSLILADLNEDGVDEVIAAYLDRHYWIAFERVQGSGNSWRRAGTLQRVRSNGKMESGTPADVLRSAEKGDIWLLPPVFYDIRLGGFLYRVSD